MKKSVIISPQIQSNLALIGERIKLARLRRKFKMKLICERAGISRATLWQVEKGNPNISIGIYAAVLHAINNLDTELLKILEEDKLGVTIMEYGLKTYKRGKK